VLLGPSAPGCAVVIPVLDAMLPVGERCELKGGEGHRVEAAADGGVEEETGED